MSAAGAAFVEAHQVVLQGAAVLMLALAVAVSLILRGRKIDAGAHG